MKRKKMDRLAWIILSIICRSYIAGCVLPEDDSNAGNIPVGLLLSFTGNLAATGATIERSVLMVLEEINAAGGIAGQSLGIETRDTSSERRAGLDAAKYLLEETNVVGIIGPDEETLAKLLLEFVLEKKVAQIFGGVTSPAFSDAEDEDLWFRTIPSSVVQGRVLAERMEADRVKSAAVITILNEFGLGFGRVIMEELNNRNIDTKILSHFNPTERNFKNLIELVSNSSAHSIVLAADPATGARIVQEWDITRMPVRWYFASTLKSDVFVQNVPQKILNNAVGVAPQLGADAQRFSEAFAQRWYGETPTPEAVFYYDAMAVMALALVKMQVEEGKLTRSGTLPIHIRSVANPPGNRVGWNQLQRGVELIRNRQEIDYQGASGQVDFDEVGDVKSGQAALWGIEENRIKNLR